MVRPFDKLTAHHKRNQHLTVRPELVEGLSQRLLNLLDAYRLHYRLRFLQKTRL